MDYRCVEISCTPGSHLERRYIQSCHGRVEYDHQYDLCFAFPKVRLARLFQRSDGDKHCP